MHPLTFQTPAVWIWWLGYWRFCLPSYPQYPHETDSPPSFWCYENPSGVCEIVEDDYTAEWNYLDTAAGAKTRDNPRNIATRPPTT